MLSKVVLTSFSRGRVNSGAGFPIRGDGTSFGLSDRPFHKKAQTAKKTISGIRNLVAGIAYIR